MLDRYKFYLEDTLYTEDDIPSLVDHPKYTTILASREKFYNLRAVTERVWRNFELSNTDWMLVLDATYSGEVLAGSQKLVDILDYRNKLRQYNLTTDDRPSRPGWFNG